MTHLNLPKSSSNNDVITNLSDFMVFGRYTILIFMVHLFDVSQMGLSYTYPTYAYYFPKIESCGNFTFDEHVKISETCAAIDQEHFDKEPCEPQFQSGFTSMPSEFEYYCDGMAPVKTAMSIQMTAMIFGSVVMGQLSDMWGRKPMLLAGSAGTAIFHLAASFIYTLPMFTFMEFGALFATGGVVTIVYVYLVEMMPKEHRLWPSMVFSDSPAMMASALIAYLATDWRTMARIMAAISVPHLVLQAYAFESPRWLLQRGRFEEAEEVYAKIDLFNGTSSPERTKMLHKLIECEKQRMQCSAKVKAKQYYVWHSFETTEMTVTNIVMAFNFFALSLTYYGLMLNMETLSGSVFINVFTMAALCYVFNCVYGIVDFAFPQVGRKPAYIFPIIFAVISLGIVIVLKSLDIFAPTIENIALLTATAIVGQMLSVAPMIGSELFPTPIRNAAQSFQQFWMRLGVVVSPQLFVSLKFWPIAPYLTLGILNLFVIITFGLFVRETKHDELVEHMPEKIKKTAKVAAV